jgi:NAD(P)-dependent dehydrogenase (short-subunit alcohol dehydrogenase family)
MTDPAESAGQPAAGGRPSPASGRSGSPVAVVTGATLVDPGGLNIGGAITTALVQRGLRVVVADVDLPGAQALADQLNTATGETVVRAVETDIRSEEQVQRLVAETVRTFGRLDAVANNAGIFPGGDGQVGDLDIEVWDDVMAVNVRGAMLLTKHALPHLLLAGGAIVNTSSTHSFAGDARLTGYGASKAALNALTMYTATQYAGRGVRCNAVCPGTTTSPPAQRMPEPYKAAYRRQTLNPSLNGPAEIAAVVAFLLSEEARGINGMVIRADGGLLAHQPFVADIAAVEAAR